MNFGLYVARRYLFSKKSTNAINVISGISVVGVAVATMALIVTLSVFNGFSDLVATLFTAFDPQLEVTPVEGKTAPADDPVLTEIRQLPQVEAATECVEDMALVTYHDRQAMVTVKGVDDNFDRHGTRNERMLAHYLLGCVLSDLGDSPEALQAFYDAIEMADTTRTDCDLYTLRVVYGQTKVKVFRTQLRGVCDTAFFVFRLQKIFA